jgi:diaminopimelate epimerase
VGDGAELARRICTRALSVGADGLILVEPSTRATFRMRYWNSDGSLCAFCGNGTRCAARFAFLNVIAGRKMTIETDAGIVSAEIGDGSQVTIALPPPMSFRPKRPLNVGNQTMNGSSMTTFGISVRSILIRSVSPEGKVTVAVALLFLIWGVLTLKFFSQPLSQSCAQMKMSASMRRMSRGAFA